MIDGEPSALLRERPKAFADRAPQETGVGAAPVSGAPVDVLFLMNALSVGGSERKVVRLANELAARRFSVAVVSLNEPDTLAPLLSAAVPRWRLDRRGKFSFSAVRKLLAIIERQRPRLIVCVNMYPTLYATAAKAILQRQSPRIAALVNTTDFGPRERWRQRFYTHVLRRLDALVYGCQVQLDTWTSQAPRLGEHAEVIYNGVDLMEFRREALGTDRASLRLEAGYAPGTFLIGSVGRLIPAKNHAALIDATAQLRRAGIDAALLVAGEGPLRATLEQRAADLGIAEFVRFTGALTDVRPVLAMLDVFVLPSLYIETFSNAALEAMAMSTPVVLSRIGGAAEMVRHGEEGYLVEPQALALRLPELLTQLAREPRLRERMSVSARQRAEREFGFQNMIERYASLIRRFAA